MSDETSNENRVDKTLLEQKLAAAEQALKSETFNVCQFFMDETHEYVRRNVPIRDAIKAYQHYTTSVGAKLGTTVRVIMTDRDDYIVMEWDREHGQVYPHPD
jgi:hypothetical protein